MKKVFIGFLLSCTLLYGHGFRSAPSDLVGSADYFALPNSNTPTSNCAINTAVVVTVTFVMVTGYMVALYMTVLGNDSIGLDSHRALDTNLAMAQLD